MTVQQNTQEHSVHYEALAVLYDLFSLGFAYPSVELRAELEDGGFVQQLRRCTEALACPASIADTVEQLQQRLQAQSDEQLSNHLESDYIGLFELSKELAPLHLYAHLYVEGSPNPVILYRHLLAIYRESGIELKQGEGAEQPDHLTVMLEFLAYLYRLRAQAQEGENGYSTARLEEACRAFHKELAWVRVWLDAMEKRDPHPLYTGLGRLLWQVLEYTESISGQDARPV